MKTPSTVKEWAQTAVVVAGAISAAYGGFRFVVDRHEEKLRAEIEEHDAAIENAIRGIRRDQLFDRCQKRERAAGLSFELAVRKCEFEFPIVTMPDTYEEDHR